jgi:hypothetical protein
MTAQEKQQHTEAVKVIYGVSTRAAVEKAAHDTCLNAAQALMSYFEGIQIEEPKLEAEK